MITALDALWYADLSSTRGVNNFQETAGHNGKPGGLFQ
jgi:hypothetical protein